MLGTRATIVDGALPPGAAAATGAKLEVRELTLAHDGRVVLDKVSLTLAPGTVTAIVGRTGSGGPAAGPAHAGASPEKDRVQPQLARRIASASG